MLPWFLLWSKASVLALCLFLLFALILCHKSPEKSAEIYYLDKKSTKLLGVSFGVMQCGEWAVVTPKLM
jgi:hypothetical protein